MSDIGFVRLPEDQAWLGHRRVRSVNGRPVRGKGTPVENLFTGREADRVAVARRIADENAGHNLGHPRTTNVPTLPLDLLHPRHSSAYEVSIGNIDRRNGVRVARLTFREGAKGSIVAYDSRSFVRTLVTAWVEMDAARRHAATGAV